MRILMGSFLHQTKKFYSLLCDPTCCVILLIFAFLGVFCHSQSGRKLTNIYPFQESCYSVGKKVSEFDWGKAVYFPQFLLVNNPLEKTLSSAYQPTDLALKSSRIIESNVS